MNKVVGFTFFLLLLAAIALISLKSMRPIAQLSAIGEIVGISWQPVSISELDVPIDSAMRLQFGTDGKLSGHSACNDFSGDFIRNGEAVRIRPVVANRMACPESETTLENHFLEILGRTVLAESRAGRLTLSDAEGKVLVILQPAAADL